MTGLNDDTAKALGNIYDNEYPHPVFDPNQICFRNYRNFPDMQYNDRRSIKKNVRTVFQDIEAYSPSNTFYDQKFNPLTAKDFVITSCVTNKDHMWPVPYVYNNYHFVKTHEVNCNKKISKPTNRSFFADVFLDTVHDPQQKIINDQKLKASTDTTVLLNGNFISQHISETIMENSWISVIAETFPSNDCFFVTEKTAKPLMAGRPFIMLGGSNYLKQLRQLGFQTFSPVIDESYDVIPDLNTRVVAAFQSFKKLAAQDPVQITQKLMPILQHNQEIMYKKRILTQNARLFLDDLHTRYAYYD